MKKSILTILIASIALFSTGCASKPMVKKEVKEEVEKIKFDERQSKVVYVEDK